MSLVGNVRVALANIIKGTIFGTVSVDFPTSDRNIILQTDIQLPNLLLNALVVYRLKPMLASAESQSLCEGMCPCFVPIWLTQFSCRCLTSAIVGANIVPIGIPLLLTHTFLAPSTTSPHPQFSPVHSRCPSCPVAWT